MARPPAQDDGEHARLGPGRPSDHSGDAAILAVTLEALADQAYEHLTLDVVAAMTGRAKTTLYRRWPSKLDLVVAAVRSAGPPPELDRLPDTGSLRGDLLAVIDSPWLGGPERRARLVGGLVAAARSSAVLADVVRTAVTEPYASVYERLLRRALDRGEVGPLLGPHLPLLAQVVPAMTSLRVDSLGLTARSSGAHLVDVVLLPALGLAR